MARRSTQLPLGTPKPLFESSGTLSQATVFVYSPSADGRRFLIKVFAIEAQPSLEVLLWAHHSRQAWGVPW